MSEVVSLESLCSGIIDCPHSTPNWKVSGIPVIRNYNLVSGRIDKTNLSYVTEEEFLLRTKRAVPEYEDLIISREAPMGVVGIVPEKFKCCLGQRLVLLKVDKEKCYPKFLLYSLMSNFVQKQIERVNLTGSIVSNLNISSLQDLQINLVTYSQQVDIANCLDLLDQKIAINNQINEELEAMAKTLYDYWFVQFDFPDENGKPYKSSGGKMVYNDQLKREIPEGWGVKQLGELSTYVTDKISSNDLNSKNYIGTDNMLSNMKGIEQATYLPNSTLVNSFIPNDILIANIRPYFKKIWISDRTGGCSSDVLCLRANDKEICNYLFYSLARDDFFNYNVAGSKGSKMPRGDKAHIQKYSVLFSEKYALKFSKLVSNFISQKHLIYKQNQELSQLRDWLLPMLMNGQVRVEDNLWKL
ncbi:TPA: restriction endonuclease subunit S [Streptococcus suis]